MNSQRIVNPLKRRRVGAGLSQKEMAERLGVTQSQYSRIESARTDPTKYLDKLGEILGCLPDEVYGHAIMKEIEDEYLNDTTKTQRMEYHERRLDSVYLNLKGWFSRKELDLLCSRLMRALTASNAGKTNKRLKSLSRVLPKQSPIQMAKLPQKWR